MKYFSKLKIFTDKYESLKKNHLKKFKEEGRSFCITSQLCKDMVSFRLWPYGLWHHIVMLQDTTVSLWR